MRTNRWILALLALVVIAFSQSVVAQPINDDDLGSIKISGTIGLAQAGANSCIAVWVPVGNKMAISGIKWYNNDESVSFAGVFVQSGTADYPVSLSEAFQVAGSIGGESLGWSEVNFSEPVACASEGLYVIFKVPSGALATAEGFGGGPAIGYTSSKSGYPGWMSADGESWVQIHKDFGFAVCPITMESTAGMVTKSMGRASDEPGMKPSSDLVVSTMLRPAAPNPFNPQTRMDFSLREAGHVELAVFNLKGALVNRLVDERMSAGEHSAVWNGKDNNGASLASGVYFARFVAGGVVMTQRLVLIQ